MNSALATPAAKKPDRRTILTGTAVAAAGIMAAGLLTPSNALAVSPALRLNDLPGTGDVKILNYALALEVLEADLYVQALMRLTTGGRNALGVRIPGLGVSNSAIDVVYLRQFGKVEVEHRDFLNAALGGSSLLKQAPFNRAKFDFKIQTLNRKQVVDLVYLAERTGVSAYLGAIPFFKTRTFLQVAGAIQGTEARHTAIIADVLNDLFNEGLSVAPSANQNQGRDVPVSPDATLAAVSPFIVL